MSSEERLALTLWPEWAWAIAHFGKDVENRSWPPPQRIVGKWLAIHAGKFIGGKKGEEALLAGLCDLYEMAQCVAEKHGDFRIGGAVPGLPILLPQIATSAIVAVAKVEGTVHGAAAGWYNGGGNHGWKLGSIIALPQPVPCKGAQGLWTVPADVLQRVREQIQRASQVSSSSRSTGVK